MAPSAVQGTLEGAGAAGLEGEAPERNKMGRQEQTKRFRGGRHCQQTAAREVRRSAGGTRLRAEQKRARREKRGGTQDFCSEERHLQTPTIHKRDGSWAYSGKESARVPRGDFVHRHDEQDGE
jgi:hypothetical protein